MPAHDDIREGLAEAFNALSDEFMPKSVVTLLKPSDTLAEYETIFDIQTNRFVEFTENRTKLLLEIAASYDDLTDTIAEATHIQVDDDIYLISVADTVVPKSTDVTWKLFGDLETRSTAGYVRI